MTISNNEIKRIRALQQKKFRDETGLFVAEGEKLVGEALNSGFHVQAVYRRDEIGDDAMSRISSLSSPSPVLAVVSKPEDISIGDVESVKPLLADGGLFLALDSIRDPGNLGTILRIADWFGIKAVFASEDTVDVFNPKTVQATMGAVFRVRMHYLDLVSLSRLVTESGGTVYGTFLDGRNLYEMDLNVGSVSPSLIVIGNEANGISPEMEAVVSDRLHIPPYPQDSPGSESLNAAVATAVTVAEFRRRK